MASHKTPPGILSFPHMFVPRPPAPGAEPRFSGVLIFDEEAQQSEEYKKIKAAVAECAREKFGADVDFNSINLPFRDGASKQYQGYGAGKIFISPWSKQKPGIVNAQLQEIFSPDDVWAGQLARFTVNPFAYNTSGNKGVSLGLNNVQILKTDLPRLDGRLAASSEFDAVDSPDSGTEEDPF